MKEKWGVIRAIHPKDAFVTSKKMLIGLSGVLHQTPCANEELAKKGWKTGTFIPDRSKWTGDVPYFLPYFFAVKVVTPRGGRNKVIIKEAWEKAQEDEKLEFTMGCLPGWTESGLLFDVFEYAFKAGMESAKEES